MLNGLDLFSGIGGLTLALAPWVQPVAYCEFDRHATALLLSRMAGGDIPTAPIWDDVRSLKGDMFPCPIDIIYGGFPCQDISTAGNGKGLEGERSGLFYQATRLIRECKPQLIFLENVAGIRKLLPIVRGELEELGYSCRCGFIPAPPIQGFSGIRWFLLAAAESFLGQKWMGIYDEYVDDESTRENSWPLLPKNYEEMPRAWEASFCEPSGEADDVPFRMDRIKGLGNAVVPLQAREAFKILMGLI